MAQARIKLALDAKQALEGLDQVTSKFKSMAQAVTGPLGDVAELVGSLAKNTLDLALAGDEAERVERRLFTSMQLRSGITRESFKALQDHNESMQRKLGLDADDLAQLQGTLSLRGVANDQLEQATKFVIGLGEANVSQSKAIKLVTDAYDGNIKGLQKLIPSIRSTQGAFDEMNKLFEVAEANSGDLTSQWDRLNAGVKDLEENFGKLVATTGVVQSNVNSLNHRVDELLGILSGNTGLIESIGLLNRAAIAVTNPLEAMRLMMADAADDARKLKEEAKGAADQLDRVIRLDPISIDKLLKDDAKARKEAAKPFTQLTLDQPQPFADPATVSDFELGGRNKRFEDEVAKQVKLFEELGNITQEGWANVEAIQQKAATNTNAIWQEMGMSVGQGLGNMIGAIQQGEAGIGQALGGLFNSLIGLIVPKLLGMATAAEASGVAASTLGTPAAIFGGILLAGATAAFAALGSSGRSALAGRGNRALAQARSGQVPTFGGGASITGHAQAKSVAFQPDFGRKVGSTVVNVHFGSGPAILGGDPARIARDVSRFLSNNLRASQPASGR